MKPIEIVKKYIAIPDTGFATLTAELEKATDYKGVIAAFEKSTFVITPYILDKLKAEIK